MPLLLSAILSCFFIIYGYAIDNKKLLEDEKAARSVKKVEKKYRKLTADLRHTREKILSVLSVQEKKLQRYTRVSGTMSIDSIYQQSVNSGINGSMSNLNNYLPVVDSLSTGFRFMGALQGTSPALTGVMADLQKEWNATQMVQGLVQDRYRQLESLISSTELVKQFKVIKTEIAYYQLTVSKYKQLLQHPDRLVQEILQQLRRQPGFADYMATNSQLAAIFGTGNTAANPLAGLQTLAGTQQQLTQQMGGSGISNPSAMLSNQLAKGELLIQTAQQKLNQLGGGESLTMPDFKPNMQRTKKFLERWVWGINLQSQRPNGWLPTTTDLALMTGYQFNDKVIAGAGLAYKMGWGKNIRNIQLLHEGMGLRLFTDIKLKGSIWISGGYEWNHQSAFNRIRDLSALSAWQRSGLIGLSKKYRIGKKKGSIQLLWDFLSYGQMPQGRVLKFRVGYGL